MATPSFPIRGTIARISATRALKNASFLQQQAARILPAGTPVPDFVHLIPMRTLGQLHRSSRPSSLVRDPQIERILDHVTFPRITGILSDPLFSGDLFFVQIQFTVRDAGNAVFSVGQTDILTAIDYATRAAIPIHLYASQYGPNSIAVDTGILNFPVKLDSYTYTDKQLSGWINTIVVQDHLPSNACVVILNPQRVTNTDADPSQGIGGYHGKANVPYIFVNLFGQGLSVADQEQFYALALSHEIAEMTVDPQANLVNPDVCDPCGPNCQNVFVAYFRGDGTYIGTQQASGFPPGPPNFPYVFMVNAIVKPPSATQCPASANDCNYGPHFPPHLDLFATGTDGAVWSTWWEAPPSWQPWFVIHPEVKMQPGVAVTALWAPNSNHLDLFATGTDGTVWSSWWEAGPAWQPWFPIHPEVKMQPGAVVTALWAPNSNHLDLFATGADGTVWSTWWEWGPSWQPWFSIPSESPMQPGAVVTALWAPNRNHLDLFATGTDGAVWSTWWQWGPSWQSWFPIHSEVKMQPGVAVTALWAPNGNHLDLFATGTDGTVWSTWWEAGPSWQPWFVIHPEVKMEPGTAVAAQWAPS